MRGWDQHLLCVFLHSFLILSWIGKTRHFISWLENPEESDPGTAVLMLFIAIT